MVRLVQLILAILIVSTFGDPVRPQHSTTQPASVPIVYNPRLNPVRLSQKEQNEIEQKARIEGPKDLTIWFVYVLQNQRNGDEMSYDGVVYYAPDANQGRVRRGVCLHVSTWTQDLVRQLQRRLGGHEQEQPNQLQPYLYVCEPSRARVKEPQVPSHGWLPFRPPDGFSDEEIIALVDTIKTPSKEEQKAERLWFVGKDIDRSLPIMSIKRVDDSIEVMTGTQEGPVCGAGEILRCKKTKEGYEVSKRGDWVS